MTDNLAEDILRYWQLSASLSFDVPLGISNENYLERLTRIIENSDLPESDRDAYIAYIPHLTSDQERDNLRFFADRLLPILTTNDLAVLKCIPIGTLPVPLLNAQAKPFENGGPIIVVYINLPPSIFEAARWFMASVRLPNSAPEATFNEASYAIYKLTLFFNTNNPKYFHKPLELRSAQRIGITGGIYANALHFILGHELGHVALGHLNLPSSTTCRLLKSDPNSINLYVKNHEQEYDADRFGAKLVIDWALSQHRGSAEMAILGYEFFFKLIQYIETIFPPPSSVPSHPPTEKRIEALRQAFATYYDKNVLGLIAQIENFFRLMTNTTNYVLSRSSSGCDSAKGEPPKSE